MGTSNLRGFDRLLALVTQYSKKIMARDISHSLNNFLTPLQIKQQLLSMSVNQDESPAEALKIADIGDNLKSLKEFSSGLTGPPQGKDKLESLHLHNFILQISKTLSELGISGYSKLTNNVNKHLPDVRIDSNCLEVLILSYIATVIKVYGVVNLVISSELDEDLHNLVLVLKSTRAEVQEIQTYPLLIETLTSQIPLTRLIRVAESETGSLSIDYHANRASLLSISIRY